MPFKLKGIDKVRRELTKLSKRSTIEAKKALRMEGETIMTSSKRDFVPVDFGILKTSGKVGDVKIKGNELSVVLSYGGAAAPYALAVHETPSEHDPPTWKGKKVKFVVGGSKYLHKPMMEAIPGMSKRIAKRIGL